MMEIDLSGTFDFVISFIFHVILIVFSVAAVIEGYMENEETRKEKKRKIPQEKDGAGHDGVSRPSR